VTLLATPGRPFFIFNNGMPAFDPKRHWRPAIIKASAKPTLIEIDNFRAASLRRGKSACPYFAQIGVPNDYAEGLMRKRIGRLAIAPVERVMAHA
jgi:hypothetical protein